MVEDTLVDSRREEGGFIFFSDRQRERIKSMVAYRYLVENSEKPEALILTMDTTSPGFFSPSREFECRLVLDEIAKRIELELIALNLNKKINTVRA